MWGGPRHKIYAYRFFYVQPKNLRIVGTYNRYGQKVKFYKIFFYIKNGLFLYKFFISEIRSLCEELGLSTQL